MKLLTTLALLSFSLIANAGPLEQAKLHLENQMKDPSSLTIDAYDIRTVTNKTGDETEPSAKTIVCGIYNGKNGYGAYAGRQGFSIMIRQGVTHDIPKALPYSQLKQITNAIPYDLQDSSSLVALTSCMESLDSKGYPINQFF